MTSTNTSTVIVKSIVAKGQAIIAATGERLELMTGPFGGRRPKKGETLGVFTSGGGVRYATRPR